MTELDLPRLWRVYGMRAVGLLVGIAALVFAVAQAGDDGGVGLIIAVPLGSGLTLAAFLPRRRHDDVERLFALKSGARRGGEDPGGGADDGIGATSARPELIPMASDFLEIEAKRTATTRSSLQLLLGALVAVAALAMLLAPFFAQGILAAQAPVALHQLVVLAAAGACVPLVVFYRRLFPSG